MENIEVWHNHKIIGRFPTSKHLRATDHDDLLILDITGKEVKRYKKGTWTAAMIDHEKTGGCVYLDIHKSNPCKRCKY